MTPKRKNDWLAAKKNYPWMLVYENCKNKCRNPKTHYYKMGIKSYLTKENVKFLWFKYGAELMKKPSIDRMDTNGHYTLENTRFIELDLNLNRPKRRKKNSLGYSGVSIRCDKKAYTAQICSKGKRINIGSFNTPKEAALAWNKKAKEIHGKEAILNKIGE